MTTTFSLMLTACNQPACDAESLCCRYDEALGWSKAAVGKRKVSLWAVGLRCNLEAGIKISQEKTHMGRDEMMNLLAHLPYGGLHL